MEWFKNGLLDPSQVGQFAQPRRNEIRGSLGLMEEPGGFENSEEPAASDLVVEYQEPVLGPGDVVRITIPELMTPGATTEIPIQIGNTGYETLPQLGRTRLAGFTPRELELELKRQLREQEILPDADVRVVAIDVQSAQYSVIGFVTRPGAFPIPRPEYRLLDAVAAIGGISDEVEKIYVVRRQQPGGPPERTGPGPETQPTEPPIDEGMLPYTMSDVSPGAAGASQPSSGTSSTIDELDILEGRATSSQPMLSPRYDEATKEWVLEEAPATGPDMPQHAPEMPAQRMDLQSETPPSQALDEPVEGTAEGESDLKPPARIIEIPLKDLMSHDPRYNVVIRPFDIINVPAIEQGEYYMAGHIARPGTYRFPGRQLTVKEAIASAGGFDELAWPSRADLIRRVNTYEEQIIQVDLDAIFAGNMPDFYMKPHDILNVGTTALAPFMAVIRNSFRLSYGFGFVYDRNFADKDEFAAKEQRKARRAQEAQSRGLPFR